MHCPPLPVASIKDVHPWLVPACSRPFPTPSKPESCSLRVLFPMTDQAQPRTPNADSKLESFSPRGSPSSICKLLGCSSLGPVRGRVLATKNDQARTSGDRVANSARSGAASGEGRGKCSHTGALEEQGLGSQDLVGHERSKIRRKRVFFLDVAPLCYRGKKPQPSALIEWIKLLFKDVTDDDPIVAVMDGEKGNEYRKSLLPSYKANRNSFVPLSSKLRQTWKGDDADLREAFPAIKTFLQECNIPVVRVDDAEADDVVASLAEQAIQKGMHIIVASPDKDFKQLLCKDVQIVVPLIELGRWSFYTHEKYIAQHGCNPSIELSLRCMLGDRSDNVPGLAEHAPGFGRNTALKLMKKHGSLENLLNAAASRTVGKPYIQNALSEYGPLLRRNLEVLGLRRDVSVIFQEEWCLARDSSKDELALSKLKKHLKDLQQQRAVQDGLQNITFSRHSTWLPHKVQCH